MHAAGIIHRDIKPGNMVVSQDRGYLQLIDFGSADESTTGQHDTFPSLMTTSCWHAQGQTTLHISKCRVSALLSKYA